MTTARIRATGRLLAASKTDPRVLSYLLLPYGEVGHAGLVEDDGSITPVSFSVASGDVVPPQDVASLVANIEHDPLAPAAKFLSVEDTPDGLTASVRVLATSVGDDLLVEVAEGVRDGISVELQGGDPAHGTVKGAELVGAGFVRFPAFASARVAAVEAQPTTPDLPDAESEDPSVATASDASPEPEEHAVTDNTVSPAEALVASKNGALSNPVHEKTGPSKREVLNLIASAHRSGNTATLLATLTDVGESVFDDARQDQWLGEVWDGRQAPLLYTGLVAKATLTARKAVGWKYSDKPTVADWAGFPNEIHSSDISLEPVEVTAQRLAGGARFDRSLIDFGEIAFIDSYFRFCADDYALKLDGKVLATINSASTAVTGGSIPSGADPASVKIIDGALALLADNVVPTFALVSQDLYRGYALTPKDKTLEYFPGTAGLEGGGIAGLTVVPAPTSVIGTNKVIVGASNAVTLFQLPGSPVRADALDIAHGGVEGALYGYYALLPAGKGIVKVS